MQTEEASSCRGDALHPAVLHEYSIGMGEVIEVLAIPYPVERLPVRDLRVAPESGGAGPDGRRGGLVELHRRRGVPSAREP